MLMLKIDRLGLFFLCLQPYTYYVTILFMNGEICGSCTSERKQECEIIRDTLMGKLAIFESQDVEIQSCWGAPTQPAVVIDAVNDLASIGCTLPAGEKIKLLNPNDLGVF